MIRRHVKSLGIAIREHRDYVIGPEIEHATRIHGNFISSSTWRLNDDNALVVHKNLDWVSMVIEVNLCIDVVPSAVGHKR